MARKLSDAVVVVTGASSGIGRATALRLAKRGSTVVLAARREAALRALAQECEQAGGTALAVPTDVTDDAAVDALARRAVEEYGRIDVWVNNAAVALFASFEESPPGVYDRVLDTNLGGCVRGARAALGVFREQGSGVLINNASVYAKIGAPYLSAYVASKHAIAGLSESLRMELIDDDDIHVCTVLPASIDTPLFQHAANYTGREVKPLDPVYDADVVAKAIVGLARKPRRERIVGGAGRFMRRQRQLSPAAFERATAKLVRADHFADEPAERTAGNVVEPVAGWTGVSGGWESSRGPLRRAAVPVALAVAGAGVLASRRRH